MKTLITTVTAISVLSACATPPPNTPGSGSGDSYTPFVDMQGIDQSRYSSDLASCREYARLNDPNKKAMEGMIGGILVGALIGAAIGGSRYHAEQGALAGGTSGSIAGGSKAIAKQETILANCMAGRGYRVLDGATQPTNTAIATPYTYTAGRTQSFAAAATPTSSAPRAYGQEAGSVEREARQWACSSTPSAELQSKGPGFETYTVRCAGGDIWAYRCEFGNCTRTK